MSELKVWVAYNKYQRWCRGLGIRPAAFKVWSQTTAQIGDHLCATASASRAGHNASSPRHGALN